MPVQSLEISDKIVPWCRSLFLYCCDKAQTKTILGNGLFGLQVTVHCGGKSRQEFEDRNLEAEAEAEIMNECCLLASSLPYYATFLI